MQDFKQPVVMNSGKNFWRQTKLPAKNHRWKHKIALLSTLQNRTR